MRIVVERVEHDSVFHQYQEMRDSIQLPIVNKFKRRFILGQYGSNYCPQCGQLMEFKCDRGDNAVEAILLCRPCGGKEQPQYVRYGDGI